MSRTHLTPGLAGSSSTPFHQTGLGNGGPGGHLCRCFLTPCPPRDTLGKQTLSYLLKKAKQEGPAAPELPEAQHLHHAHAGWEDPEKVVQLDCERDLGGAWNRATLGRFVLHTVNGQASHPAATLGASVLHFHPAPNRRSTASPSSRPSS